MRQRAKSIRDEILKGLSDEMAPEFDTLEKMLKWLREEYKLEVTKHILYALSREGLIREVWTLTYKGEKRLEEYLEPKPELEKKKKELKTRDMVEYRRQYLQDNRDQINKLQRDAYHRRKVERKEG